MAGHPKEFTVTEDHLKLLDRLHFRWSDVEYGAPEVDPKRPYGNSDVSGDVAEILGWWKPNDFDEEMSYQIEMRCGTIHEEMMHVLQILVQNPVGFKTGVYVSDSQYGVRYRIKEDDN